MSLTFPDNENRKNRVLELANTVQYDLSEAQQDYSNFRTLVAEVNPLVSAVYREAGLQPPPNSPIDVINLADPATHSTESTFQIFKILADIAGFAGTLKYMAPAASRALVRSGLMSAERAAAVLLRFTLPVLERQVVLTTGELAGGILSAIGGGILVAGFDLGIDAIEGSIARDKLRTAIHDLRDVRIITRVSKERAKTLLDSLRAVKVSMDALQGAGVPLTDKVLENIINRDAEPSITAEQKITADTVKAELTAMDLTNHSWTNEDY